MVKGVPNSEIASSIFVETFLAMTVYTHKQRGATAAMESSNIGHWKRYCLGTRSMISDMALGERFRSKNKVKLQHCKARRLESMELILEKLMFTGARRRNDRNSQSGKHVAFHCAVLRLRLFARRFSTLAACSNQQSKYALHAASFPLFQCKYIGRGCATLRGEEVLRMKLSYLIVGPLNCLPESSGTQALGLRSPG